MHQYVRRAIFLHIFSGAMLMPAASQALPPETKSAGDMNASAAQFVADYEARVRPLEIALNLAWWNANTTGKDEDFAAKVEAQNRYDQALSDRERFARLKTCEKVSSAILCRPARSTVAPTGKTGRSRASRHRPSRTRSKNTNVYRAKLGRQIADSEVQDLEGIEGQYPAQVGNRQ
jgi:peptidyl-dipeptidase A